MSLILSAELAAACNALGSYDPKTNTYYAEDNILEAVKDLIRYLRRDTESHEIRRHFGTAKILQLNLIPLLKMYWEQTDLFDVLLRLLGNLTSPVLLLYNEEIPKEKTVRNHFLQILEHLQSYKEAFADYDLWAVLCTRLSNLLSIDWHERGEENGLIIERILILVRNVLSVPLDPDAEKRPDNDVSAHDKVLWSLRKSGLVDIIHYMVSSDQEESYYMYILEIITLMLRDHRPADLANAADTRTQSEKDQDEAEFLSIRKEEMNKKGERFRSYTSARHSRFGGTFVFKNVKSVNDSQELIYHKALNKANVLNFDADKSKKRIPKNRINIHETTNFRRSTFSIRLLLKDFCIEFLNSGYNKIMQNVRGKLIRGQSESHDETYYLWAVKFFMEFNRSYKFDLRLVSETMSIQIFHYVQQQMENNFDRIMSDKKTFYLWSKRLHLALLAYKELLQNLLTMEKSTDDGVRQSAKVIKSNVFYVLEYREFLLTLLVTYNPQKLSDIYLIDLIETQHIFLKMLEVFCGKNNTIVVQNRQKVRKKKKTRTVAAPVIPLEESLDIKWDEIGPQISVVLEGGENIPVLVPFDAASDVPINDQKVDAMIKIQNYLRRGEFENAIGMLRSARDVWPDNDSFGSRNMSVEEEFLAIREIFYAKLQDSEEIDREPPPTNEEYDEEDEENDEEMEIEKEVDFTFKDFVSRFANPKVVKALSLALKNFETNTPLINHCILKLLHRIAWDCRMPAMLFQASIFRIFQRIFAEKHRREFKELVKFATYIIKQFVKVAETNKKVFMELLFWKNSKEAYDVEQGYGSYQKSRGIKNPWSPEEEDELRVLVNEYKEKNIEEDVADWVVKNLIDNTKTRRMVIKKLKDLMLIDYKSLKKSGGRSGISSRVSKEWTDEEIEQLRELVEEFRNASDPLTCIVDRLTIKRPKTKVKSKILELGLLDANALRKKRASKSEGPFIRRDDESDIIDSTSSSSDESSKENRSERSNIPSSVKKQSASTSKRASKKIGKPSNEVNLLFAKKLIIQVINLDMVESLKWISESLTEAAEDQEQDIDLDENEGVPLVAITEHDVLAMEHSVFQKMLLAIGIKRPASEQEIYWRIPGNLKATELRKMVDFINEVIEKPNEESIPKPVNDESSDDDVFDKLRNLVAKPNEEVSINSISQIEEKNPEDLISSPSTSKITSKKKRIQIMEDSEESDLENNQNTSITPSYSEPSTSSKKQISRILNDSDQSNSDDNSKSVQNTQSTLKQSQRNKNSSKKKKNVISDESSHSGSDDNSRKSSRQSSAQNSQSSVSQSQRNKNTPKKSSEESNKSDSDDNSRKSSRRSSVSNSQSSLSQSQKSKNSPKKKKKIISQESSGSDSDNNSKISSLRSSVSNSQSSLSQSQKSKNSPKKKKKIISQESSGSDSDNNSKISSRRSSVSNSQSSLSKSQMSKNSPKKKKTINSEESSGSDSDNNSKVSSRRSSVSNSQSSLSQSQRNKNSPKKKNQTISEESNQSDSEDNSRVSSRQSQRSKNSPKKKNAINSEELLNPPESIENSNKDNENELEIASKRSRDSGSDSERKKKRKKVAIIESDDE